MGRVLKYAVLIITASMFFAQPTLRADTIDQFTYVADGGDTFQWQLAPSPAPPISTGNVSFGVTGGFTENGSLLSGTIFFENALNGGGLEIFDAGLNLLASAEGDQVYTGTEDAPTFVPGSYANLVDQFTGGVATLTITETQVAPVPEPSTLVLLGSGLLALGLSLAIKKLR